MHTNHFPALLRTTKLAQSTSQHYCVHKLLPGTTKLAQSTSQYYFIPGIPQRLHKVLLSTTLYYEACTQHVPVLLCTTKLAENTSDHDFVLQRTSSEALSHRSFDTEQSFDREAFTHNKLLHKELFTQTTFLIHYDSRNCSFKTGRPESKKIRC